MCGFLPDPTPVSTPFWASCKAEKLRLQQCRDCHRYIYYPSYICAHCGADDLEWRDISGKGSVYSSTVMERQAEVGEVPPLLALIELDEGPVMMSRIVAPDPHAVAIGDRVRVVFESVSEDISLPLFEPDDNMEGDSHRS